MREPVHERGDQRRGHGPHEAAEGRAAHVLAERLDDRGREQAEQHPAQDAGRRAEVDEDTDAHEGDTGDQRRRTEVVEAHVGERVRVQADDPRGEEHAERDQQQLDGAVGEPGRAGDHRALRRARTCR